MPNGERGEGEDLPVGNALTEEAGKPGLAPGGGGNGGGGEGEP